MNIGQEVLEQLKNDITEVSYNRYIKQLTYDNKKSTQNMAIYYAPNPLICNWVKSKYSQKIANIFEQINNSKVDVTITLKSTTDRIAKKQKIEQKTQHSLLNPSHTFDNFMVGGSNQFASTAVKSVSEKFSQSYNPL
ncbi:MAG: chromosomal replication initiator protein DnaA, partial [Epsilonproteobacteria bacterium]